MESGLALNISATVLTLMAYIYLYVQYRQECLAKWMAGWVIYLLRQVFLEQLFVEQQLSPSLMIVYSAMTLIYSLLMISGTMAFAKLRAPHLNKMIITVGMTIIIICGVLLKLPISACTLPVIIVTGFTYITTGIIFLKIYVKGLGNMFAGTAFIILGVHSLNMIFLLPCHKLLEWGFLVDGLIRMTIAIAIVIVYFEEVRKKLAEQGTYFRLLTENATDIIYRYRLIDPIGVEYVSPAVKKLTGYNPDHFRSLWQVLKAIYPADRPKFREISLTAGTEDDFATIRVRHKNGDIGWAEQKKSIIYDDKGRPIAVDGIIRDVTQRVRLENDVARLDQLNIAGQMAANLAHEVRNPLTTLRGYLQFLGVKEEFEEYKARFSLMLEEVDRTNTIITEYLALSKHKVVDMKKRKIDDIVKIMYPLLQTDGNASNVEVELSLATKSDIWLDDKEIKQLILNLTRNAIEAMPGGGKIRLVTTETDEGIIFSVIDNGAGIPQHILENIGKPFFTTKESGTGLGLAICYRIVGRHHGKLDIATGISGTTIKIWFPVA
ncbi:MAG: sasA 2 [Firmicutes bacterium]|nr:sasA 2 [Bacillota bacterium]